MMMMIMAAVVVVVTTTDDKASGGFNGAFKHNFATAGGGGLAWAAKLFEWRSYYFVSVWRVTGLLLGPQPFRTITGAARSPVCLCETELTRRILNSERGSACGVRSWGRQGRLVIRPCRTRSPRTGSGSSHTPILQPEYRIRTVSDPCVPGHRSASMGIAQPRSLSPCWPGERQ